MALKHYEAIAEIIKNAWEDWQGGTPSDAMLNAIENQLADYFTQDNPRFDRERFLKACWNDRE
jgi:hypothetical protein